MNVISKIKNWIGWTFADLLETLGRVCSGLGLTRAHYRQRDPGTRDQIEVVIAGLCVHSVQ